MKAFLALVTLANSTFAGTQLVEWDPHLQLVRDERIVATHEGLALVPGALVKDEHNPLFQADRPWENALNNLYPNVHYDPDQHLFHLWYKCVLHDKDVITKLAPVRTIHDQGWLLLHAISNDAITWRKPDHGLVEFDGNTHNNAVARDTPMRAFATMPTTPTRSAATNSSMTRASRNSACASRLMALTGANL